MTTTALAISGIDLLRGTAERGETPPAASLLGWTLLDAAPGRVRVGYSAREEFYNPHGTV